MIGTGTLRVPRREGIAVVGGAGKGGDAHLCPHIPAGDAALRLRQAQAFSRRGDDQGQQDIQGFVDGDQLAHLVLLVNTITHLNSRMSFSSMLTLRLSRPERPAHSSLPSSIRRKL